MDQAPGTEIIDPYNGDPTAPELRTDPEAVQALIANIEQELADLTEALEAGNAQLAENEQKLQKAQNPPPGETSITDETPEYIKETIRIIQEENEAYRYNIEDLQQQLIEAKQQLTTLTRTES